MLALTLTAIAISILVAAAVWFRGKDILLLLLAVGAIYLSMMIFGTVCRIQHITGRRDDGTSASQGPACNRQILRGGPFREQDDGPAETRRGAVHHVGAAMRIDEHPAVVRPALRMRRRFFVAAHSVK
jgi:hypothetical protein